MDGLAGEEEEFTKLVECLDKASTAYGMAISDERTNDEQHQWHQHRDQSKWTVTSFKYLGSVISDEGSKPEILSRIAQTTAALTRLKPVWNDRSISLFQDTTDALSCHVHLPVCLLIMDPHS